MEANTALNQAAIEAGGGSVHCGNLTWGVTAVASLGQDWAGPDLVVAADVVYHRELFNPLLCSISSIGKADVFKTFIGFCKSCCAGMMCLHLALACMHGISLLHAVLATLSLLQGFGCIMQQFAV